MEEKVILDACCGGRMCWFNKSHPNAVYVDIRTLPAGHIECSKTHAVEPDLVADFRELPFDDKQFKLVLYDPPHIPLNRAGKSGKFAKQYGVLFETWESDLTAGFQESMRVLDNYGVLIFKWSSSKLPLQKVLRCFPMPPLFGHTTNKKGTTHWLTFMKMPGLVKENTITR